MIDAPRDLRGRPRGDRALGLIGLVVGNYLGAMSRVPYDPRVALRPPDTAATLTVASVTPVTSDGDVAQIDLVDAGGSSLPAWQPGCHIDVHLEGDATSGPLRRQYSLCGDPADTTRYRIAVRRIGTVSERMHALRPGDTVTVRGPRNAFLFAQERSVHFVAGGIGITPILPMVRAARDLGLDWTFVYCGRSRESMPFLDEMESWNSPRVAVRTDVEDGLPTVTDLLGPAARGGAVYCCGPTPMLNTVRTSFAGCGASALHFERFGAPPVVGGRPFTVTLARSGRTLTVPADRSALSVIVDEDPTVAYSCRQGFCGTCKVRVLAGTPEHRETRLSPTEQQEHMLPCVSRADSDHLTLDV
ncbi:oxidoreductase [Rhodococcus sp. BP-332]|uniref:PDR/VanB family oxidoreductase n=1 Tax=Rhodococcus sp. BP-332 TaxID=2739447 RepID=UPI001C9A790B|nr:PDR/VanB family oxidoreductase [Rhodococcus sp. BP-332]MBY6677262.1 oxidoreductase [Rhodococcus sp. BP-332]